MDILILIGLGIWLFFFDYRPFAQDRERRISVLYIGLSLLSLSLMTAARLGSRLPFWPEWLMK